MKHLFSVLLFLSFTITSLAQSVFFVINDSDGYTNLRDENKKIVGKITDDDVFSSTAFDDIENPSQLQYIPIITIWELSDDFHRYGYNENGEEKEFWEEVTIHKSKIKSLSDLPQLKHMLAGQNKIIFYDENITIEILTNRVIDNNRDCTVNEYDTPTNIDAYPVHGTDWKLTEKDSEIQAISYNIDGTSYNFEEEHIRGFLNIDPVDNLQVAVGKNNTYYLYGMGGDGAGGYYALWVIRNGKVKAAIAHNPY